MKQLEVQIMGQSYLLACPDDGETGMLKAVERVDKAMCKIRDAGKVKARDRIAVLAALNLAFDLADPLVPSSQTEAERVQEDDLKLSAVLQRLDAALAADGQLI
jgi:cell division protein ZapA